MKIQTYFHVMRDHIPLPNTFAIMSDVEDAHPYDNDMVHNAEEEDSDEENRETSQKNVRSQEYEDEEDEEEDEEEEEDEDEDDPSRKRKKAKVSNIGVFETENLYKNNSSIVTDVLLRVVSSILKLKSVMTMRWKMTMKT